MKNTLIIYALTGLLLFFLTLPDLVAQHTNVSIETYKNIGEDSLAIHIYQAQNGPKEKHAAMIFFFGGGWVGGSLSQFEPHAKYFADKGLITVLADYRVKNRHQTRPFEALEDAKSAIRYLKENGERLGIDSAQIIAAGGSAGGHLAAATALISKYNDENDNLSISPKPAALVLFNPVLDNGPGGYGFERIGEAYPDFSPLHNVRKGAPPTLLFLGTEDQLIPVETAQYYKVVMEKVGSTCDLKLYEGQGHGFFNFQHQKYYESTILETEKFLGELGYLKSKSP
ncbi:MAG: alpha/beta hydrolase [Cyclobacteriaceae bacterium]